MLLIVLGPGHDLMYCNLHIARRRQKVRRYLQHSISGERMGYAGGCIVSRWCWIHTASAAGYTSRPTPIGWAGYVTCAIGSGAGKRRMRRRKLTSNYAARVA